MQLVLSVQLNVVLFKKLVGLSADGASINIGISALVLLSAYKMKFLIKFSAHIQFCPQGYK